jgi:hypothetical protein
MKWVEKYDGSINLQAADDLIITGNNLKSEDSGGNSGQHLRINLNGIFYKIRLERDT